MSLNCGQRAYCSSSVWYMSMGRQSGMILDDIDRGKPKNSEKKTIPGPFCPPQIPHGLTRERTRTSVVRGQSWHGLKYQYFNSGKTATVRNVHCAQNPRRRSSSHSLLWESRLTTWHSLFSTFLRDWIPTFKLADRISRNLVWTLRH
jgi:hypothetical protein